MSEPLHLRWTNRDEGEVVFHVPGVATLGRAPDNEIVIDEDGASRRHCRIEHREGAWVVVDLGSTNGTYVNGRRVREATLRPGDSLLVGRALFEVGSNEGSTRAAKTQVVGTETIQVALSGAEAGDPARLRPDRRVAGHLRTLCEVIELINHGGSPEILQQRCLETLAERLEAETGSLLVGESSADPVATWPRGSRQAPSRTILARVFGSGDAILADDPAADRELSGAVSLAGQSGKAILCVPVTLGQDVLGAIYLVACRETQPWTEADLRLASIVGRALGLALENRRREEAVRAENATLRAAVAGGREIAGVSERLRKTVETAKRVAATDATVLLTGETGTGKELFARAIHEWSGRADKPFVAVNCGAIPESVVESELFGHEKGAFTGAHERRIGRFEMAQDGTLFLDEIGELPVELQVKLLRVLEDGRFYRVGGSREIKSDVRLLLATNRDLDEEVARGRFREDLLYRIRVIEIRVPPLRERPEDIEPIARSLLVDLARGLGREPPELSAEAWERLRRYAWPGNVRELRNVLERALILSESDVIGGDDVMPEAPGVVRAVSPGRIASLKDIEREHIQAVLEATGWNKTKAAELLGIGRTNIYEKIKQYGLKPDDDGR